MVLFLDRLCVFVETSFKSLVLGFCEPMKIIALASFTNGTMNLPKEVKEVLGIREVKGKVIFVLDEKGKVYIEKA